MDSTPEHLEALQEIEKEALPGLVEVLRQEGLEAVRCVLWDAVSWPAHRDPHAPRTRADEERKRAVWEAAVRIERVLCRVLNEAHGRQVEETIDALSDGPEGFYS